VLAISIVLVAGLAWASRRLLGLPVGGLRALLAALAGFAVAEALSRSLQDVRSGHAAAFFTVALGVPLIVAMIFIVVAEALVPSGTWPGLMESVRGTRRAVARSRRYSQISRIAVRHGLGPYLRGPRRGPAAADGQAGPGGRAALARSVRQALEEGGVTFVKLGQLLSTRRDLIPEEFITELARLQDQAEPVPWGQIEEVLAQSLGRPADEVFAELQPEPAAAASIGQVHKARLRSGSGSGPGEQVAVKVQRPDIRATVERDLDIVLRMAARLEDRTRWARSLGTLSLARGFADSLREELDFRVEARNVAALTATWPERQRAAPGGVAVVIPAVDEPLSTEFVLVTGWLDGVSLRTAGPLIDQRGLDRAQLARSLLHGLLYQITEGGVFHADPHPGNILLLADGRLGLLDLGSVGRLDAQLRSSLQELLLAMGRGDPTALCDALLDLLTRPDEIDEQQLERALGQFMANYFAGGTAPAVDMFADLVRLISRFELPIPAQIGTVFRALGTLEGTLDQLMPGFDIAAEARQYATAHLMERFSPESVGNTAADELIALLPVLRRLPPDRSRHRRPGAGQAQRQCPAARRRARPPDDHEPHPPVPADRDRRGHRRRRRDPAHHHQRAEGHPGRHPSPGDRRQPAYRRQHPGAAGAVHHLQEPVGAARQPRGPAVQFAGLRPSRCTWSRNSLVTPMGTGAELLDVEPETCGGRRRFPAGKHARVPPYPHVVAVDDHPGALGVRVARSRCRYAGALADDVGRVGPDTRVADVRRTATPR
jgi:ubiquinone biosynthesis protein